MHLTTRRLIYLPSQPTETLQSFAAPFLNLHDSHVSAPFFGPNVWQALLQPVPSGGIPTPSTGVVELKLTFKEGGAFDFHSKYETLKERAQHVYEVNETRHPGQTEGVDLEDLPVYQEQSDRPLIPPLIPQHPADDQSTSISAVSAPSVDASGSNHPAEPPPRYDDSQEIARSRADTQPD